MFQIFQKKNFISFFFSYLVFEIQCLHNLWLHLAVAAVQNLPLFGLRMKSYSYNMAAAILPDRQQKLLLWLFDIIPEVQYNDIQIE